MSEEFDVVVVGAGSAGCALAGRLSEDPSQSVLLLEAGGDDDLLEVRIPAALNRLWRTRHDWNYTTEPQPALGGRRLYWPRGKLLGGSSSMNAMIYIRGAAADYDEWAKLTGEPAWSYQHVLPLFRRMEDNARGADEFHGVGGPLRVEDLRSRHPWSRAVVQSAVAVGHPRNDDFNGARQDGAGFYQVTQRRGRRWSAADAYLRPALGRPNLTVRTGALATRVLIDRGRATGVEYRSGGAAHTVRAAGEVVLAGGAVNSPQLLLLSGVGPADHLRELGVDVVHELPGVGRELQDHPVVPVVWNVRSGRSLIRGESPSGYARWFGARRGPLTSNVAEAGLFGRSGAGDPGDTAEPDLQFHFLPVKFWRQAEVDPDVDAFTAATVLVHVHSRGSVRLRSADPAWAPAIDAGYLTDERDLDALVAGVAQAREITAAAPLAAVLAEEWSPGGTVHRRADLRRSVRDTLESLYHPVGSCRMGVDDLAVVDPQLRVRGLAGLRVVDASVMPTLVRGNTNAPTLMIAERAADLITGRTVDPHLAGAV